MWPGKAKVFVVWHFVEKSLSIPGPALYYFISLCVWEYIYVNMAIKKLLNSY